MKTHELKTWPGPFEAMWQEIKRFEVRRDDRGFEPRDRLWLREWNPETQEYTGRELRDVMVKYVLRGDDAVGFGVQPGYCVMSTHIFSAECYVRPKDEQGRTIWERAYV
jgi:hypothetical protein